MSGENTASAEATAVQSGDTGDGRERSSIGFPYNNLNDAIEVAQAIHSNVGTGECDDNQLSAWMNLSPKSSGYRIQVSAARMFGLIETTGGRHKLTQLGRAIVDPQRERESRVRAFMNVPLYARVYDNYKGGVVPPAAAVERDLVGMGVAAKQTGRARAIMERSAEQAGFYESGRNRLVMPGIASRSEAKPEGEDKGSNGKPPPPPPPPEGPTLDPLLKGLVDRLPPADTEWSAADRVKWLQTAANIFDLIYKGDGVGISVKSATAERSPRPD